MSHKSSHEATVQILCTGTDRSQQTVQTKIRLLLQKQSDQGLRCFHIPSTSFGCINAMLHQTFLFLGQLWQLFEVSQILEFLRYYIFFTNSSAKMAASASAVTKIKKNMKQTISHELPNGFCQNVCHTDAFIEFSM